RTVMSQARLIPRLHTRLIELRQPAIAPSAADPLVNNIVDLRLSIAVAHLANTLRVYRDVLAFTIEGQTAFSPDASTRALTGLSKAEVRRAGLKHPGPWLWRALCEQTQLYRAT